MKIAIGSDTNTETTQKVINNLRNSKHSLILYGALKNKNDINWVQTAMNVARAVKDKKADEGILFCWTGTGVAIVASKIPGIRAAAVNNQKIAKQARSWNHANVLCLSCFMNPNKVLGIVQTWFQTGYSKDKEDIASLKQIQLLEKTLQKK